ncbi:MAG: 2-dehydro-3-deoxyphosphogluconate aldolase/(4S)-4-hydroxy-2-oxoglutarate aldolase [Arcticibacterium sp.]|jgi:2-dehydro-3-deoxyphosphogluconate aldolase/(4S)-4-hydroxy-2-oxoglutarate aldolase
MSTLSKIFFEKFENAPIVGILRGHNLNTCRKIADCFLEAGLYTLEVTMNTEGVDEIISALAKEYPQMSVGAGTVLDTDGLQKALDAGAQFIVTPIVDKEVIKTCVAQGIPVFPGAYTPTEIYGAWALGASAVKVFPATQLGTTFIKDVLAPLNEVKLLPTGGVSLDNIRSFFEVGVVGVGMGSSLINKELVKTQNWEGLTRHFAAVKKQIDGF